jgi:hypothetical protein
MLINSFNLSEMRDSAELVAVFDNPVAEEVRLIQYDLMLFNAADMSVGSSHENWEECRLATGETMKTEIWTEVSSRFVDENETQLKAKIHASLFTRTLHRLGEASVPAVQGERVMLDANIVCPQLGDNVKIMLVRSESEEEGESLVEARCTVFNNSSSHIQRITLRSELVDDEGMSVSVDEADTHVSAGAPAVIQLSFWNKDRLFAGSRISFVLLVYHEAHRYSADLSLSA